MRGKVYARTEVRKWLRISDFTDLDHLAERLMAFVAAWNGHAHPFNWSTQSAAKVMAKYQAQPTLAPAGRVWPLCVLGWEEIIQIAGLVTAVGIHQPG